MTPKQQQEIATMTKMYQKTTCLTDKEKQQHIEEAIAKIMNNVEIRNLAIKLQTHFLGRNIFISDEECVLAIAMLERTKAEENQHRDARREGSFALGLVRRRDEFKQR